MYFISEYIVNINVYTGCDKNKNVGSYCNVNIMYVYVHTWIGIFGLIFKTYWEHIIYRQCTDMHRHCKQFHCLL